MSAQTIFRNAYRHKPYSQLGNAMLQDERLSPEAVTILVYVLSLPPNWRFRLEHIAQKRRLGRDRARLAVKELAALGYAKKRQTRRADGKMGPYEYVFTDEPGKFEDAPPQPDLQGPVEAVNQPSPLTELPAPVNQATTKKISPTKTHLQKNKEAAGKKQGSGTDVEGDATQSDTVNALVADSARRLALDARPAQRPPPMPLDREGATFRISDADLQTIEAVGGSVDELFDRTMAQKAKGRRIGNVVRYMIQAAKNDARTALGTEMGVITDIASGNQWARQAAYAKACGPPQGRKPLPRVDAAAWAARKLAGAAA